MLLVSTCNDSNNVFQVFPPELDGGTPWQNGTNITVQCQRDLLVVQVALRGNETWAWRRKATNTYR